MSLFEKAAGLAAEGRSFVTVTLLASRGHAPQDPGAKALVIASGLHAGTVGGGKLEAKAIKKAQELLTLQQATGPVRETWNLQRDVGMSCGGEVEILFELFESNFWEVFVFGAGHVAQAMIRLLLTLNCRITCVDPRAQWLDKLPAESVRLKKVLMDPVESYLEKTGIDAARFYIVMTMGHGTDFPVLEKVLKATDPIYIGVLGSEVKARKIRNELKASGIDPIRVERLRTPIGLISSSNDPAEIAVSVAAEILQVRDATQRPEDSVKSSANDGEIR